MFYTIKRARGARNKEKETFWQRTVKRKKCHQSPAVSVDDRNENKSYFTRSKSKEQYFPVQGNRIISLSTLSNNLKQCISCKNGSLQLPDTVQETREGFSSKIYIICSFCSNVNVVNTLTENNRAGPKNVNKQAVLGAVHAGMGKSQLESIMACLEVPCLSTSCFKDKENNIVVPVLEQETKISCK